MLECFKFFKIRLYSHTLYSLGYSPTGIELKQSRDFQARFWFLSRFL